MREDLKTLSIFLRSFALKKYERCTDPVRIKIPLPFRVYNGPYCVMVSTEVCGTSSSGSNPDKDPTF